jgi:hypothetical protein
MRLTYGQKQIAAARGDTFEHGRNPAIWRAASGDGRLRIDPLTEDDLQIGSLLGISVDMSGVKLPFPVGGALKKITGNGPLEFESEIIEMIDQERILVAGGIAIAGVRLAIDLTDQRQPHNSFRTMKQTLATYSLDINLLGPLGAFDRTLGGLKAVVEPEASQFVHRLSLGIESSVAEAA